MKLGFHIVVSLSSLCALMAVIACDLPPETFEPLDTDSGTDDQSTDEDTDDPNARSCADALSCLTQTGDPLACFTGLDPDAQALLVNVGFCMVLSGCLDPETQQQCLVQNCQAELLACVADN